MPLSTMDDVGLLLAQVSETLPQNRAQLRKLKVQIASQTKGSLIPNDRLLARYRHEVASGLRRPHQALERILTVNGIRSQSGVATVTVITKPYPCPGRCVYCPTETRAPKSYLPNEPAVMRALRNDYDPYRQVQSRLRALYETGHSTDKIELIVKGGTWSFYPDEYQRWFTQRCFEAANEFNEQAVDNRPQTADGSQRTADSQQDQGGELARAQQRNETATSRIVGLTIETRPDYIHETEIRRLRELGVTRVELGVQTLNERILALIVRDHTTAEIRSATQLLRDAGFKVAYHLMPNLPGATPEDDLATFRMLFEDPAYRPDTLKIYPCVVVETAQLHQWWQEGRYRPYDNETLVELLIQCKVLTPPYVRIERIIRDIPSTSIEAGCAITNLREEVQERLRARGLRCRCIRCRQVRELADGQYVLRRLDYDASGGQEIFLSFEDIRSDQLAAFLRLRIPSADIAKNRYESSTHFKTPGARSWELEAGGAPVGDSQLLAPSSQPRGGFETSSTVLEHAALVRELHTYGWHTSLHDRIEQAAQHRGFGQRLLREAERIAWEECGCPRLAVIAGVGTREYYRRFGYELTATYMVKSLTDASRGDGQQQAPQACGAAGT